MTLPSGASFLDVALEQVDKKSPVDDDLMTSIAEDLYYLKNQTGGSGGGVFEWKVNGNLKALKDNLPFRRIDGAFVMSATTLSKIGLFLEVPGDSGTLEVDIRKYRSPLTPITGIDYQYSAAIQSITRAGSAGNTQSITRSTTQINTQSITYWKAAINVDSIIYIGSDLWRYNLATAPDSDWVVGDTVVFASCTTAANNGSFTIVRVNDDGFNSIVIKNLAGVAQTAAAGNARLGAYSYDLINPASTEFVAGEKALFASHTSANNDGSLTLYAVNSGGNNLVVKNSIGVTQGGVAGTIDVLRFLYTLGAAVSTDIVVGETALFASHTSSVNDGNLPVRAVSGSTLTVYNVNGATQGGVAGTVNSNRWIYALPSDPATDFSVGHTFLSTSATDYQNNGVFTVVQVKRSGTNNLVIHNTLGITQAGAVGTLTHTRRVVKFAADQSSVYSTASRVQIKNVSNSVYLLSEFQVLEVNRGGGANYNIVINDTTGTSTSQASPSGRIVFESRSVFSTRPTITVIDDMQFSTNGVLDVTEKVIAANRMLALEILNIPTGSPQNLTAHVA